MPAAIGAILNAVLGGLAVVSTILSVIGISQSAETIFDVGKVVTDNQTFIKTFYDSILDGLGISFSSMVSGIDSSLSGLTSSVCSPNCSLSYILRITGVGSFLSGCLYVLVNVGIFRFNVFIFRLCLLKMAVGGMMTVLKKKK